MSNTERGKRPRGKGKTPVSPKKARRTQAQRSDEMRQRVIEAAATVLHRKGYAGLRTDEVARVAKVSRGAQQYHFKTKDDLVMATAEYLLREGLARGQRHADQARAAQDPIQAIVDDCFEFFLGPDFGVILDLVLASTKDPGLRGRVFQQTRESRLGVEAAWLQVLVDYGIPEAKADTILWLTISMVRGFSVRALWQRDEKLFRSLMVEWKAIVYAHLKHQERSDHESVA